MGNLDLIKNLNARRRTIVADGGDSFIKAQHDAGKKTARERLALLFDEGSFVEIDVFFGSSDALCEGIVSGYGSIEDRLVYAYAQDYSILNGAIGEIHAKKIYRVMDMALATGAPLIGLIDSGGARIDEGMDVLMAIGNIITKNAEISGVVPQISAVMGPCSGSLSMVAQNSDFVFATKSASMFMNGPQVIFGVTGKEPDLGAEANAEKVGSIQFLCEDDVSLIQSIRNLISYLPSNNLEEAPSYIVTDDINRTSENFNALSGTSFDIRQVISEFADDGQFIEIAKVFAKNIVTCFARLNGYTTGIIANQPIENDGLIDNDATNKAARFIRFCNCFGIPLVTLTDTPGFAISEEQEYGGLAKNAAKLVFAYAEATVPKVNVVLNRGYGSAYLAMSTSADIRLGWPTAKISPMIPEGAAVMIYNDDIAAADDPIKKRQEKINEYIETKVSPYIAAAKGYLDDIIEPSTTRQRIISALDMLATKRKSNVAKVFGNIPI